MSLTIVRPDRGPGTPRSFGACIGVCPLLEADRARRQWTTEDYRRKCGNICCRACGLLMAKDWWERHEAKIRCVSGVTRTFLLTWPTQPNHADAVPEVKCFLAAAEQMIECLRRTRGKFARVHGVVAGAEYAFLPNSRGGRFRPHIHLGLVCDPSLSPRLLRRRLKRLWVDQAGGHRVKPGKRRKGSSLAGFVRYLNKHPVGGTKERPAGPRVADAWRSDLGWRVMDPVRAAGRDPFGRWVAGIFDKVGFTRLQSRVRYERATLYAKVQGADRAARPFPAGVQRVLTWTGCTRCYRSFDHLVKNGHDRNGKQRYRCNGCGKYVNYIHRRPRKKQMVPGTKVTKTNAHQIKKYWRRSISVRQIGKTVGLDRRTVAKVIKWLKARKDTVAT